MVDVNQIVHGLDNAIEAGSLNAQIAPFLHSNAQKHSFIASRAKLANSKLCSQWRINSDFHSKLNDPVNLLINNGAGEAKLRDAVNHHATCSFRSLEQGY